MFKFHTLNRELIHPIQVKKISADFSLQNRRSDTIISMNISRKRFVILFLILAFAFMFISNALFGTEARVFPPDNESFLGTESHVAWKSVGYKILLPIKVVLVGPMLLSPTFLRKDPPPPFVAVVFAFYWSILALVIHYLLGKFKHF